MSVIIVGSVAARHHGINLSRPPKDIDIIGNYEDVCAYIYGMGNEEGMYYPEDWREEDLECSYGKKKHFYNGVWNIHVEADIVEENTHNERMFVQMMSDVQNAGICHYASPEWLYFLKMSHRFKKNSPHFFKTRKDIEVFRRKGISLPRDSEWLMKERETLTYNYGHPKLNVSKKDFFKGDGIEYVYCHDSIHRAVALGPQPAYTYYMVEEEEVLSSKEKFFSLPEEIRLAGVYEESCVLALERSQIPFDFKPSPTKSFCMALEKVCTSITSGWFREYAYDNFFKVLALYSQLGHDDYVKMFNENKHLLIPHKK